MRFLGALAVAGVLSASRAAAAGPSSHTPEQVRAAVEEHVQRAVRESGGIYRLNDDRTGKPLELEFRFVGVVSSGALWRVHDPTRRVDSRAFVACTQFHPVGAAEESAYDVDMMVEPRENGLSVTDVRIHKEKRLVDGKWIWEARPAAPAAAGRSR